VKAHSRPDPQLRHEHSQPPLDSRPPGFLLNTATAADKVMTVNSLFKNPVTMEAL